MLGAGIAIPVLVTVAVLVYLLIIEHRLAVKIRRPSACFRCGHEVVQSMLASGHCPECGTPYSFGGIDTPRLRYDTHVRRYRSPTACVLMGGIVCVQVTGQLLLSSTSRWSAEAIIAMGVAAWALNSGTLAILIVRRRKRLLAEIAAMEASWTDDRHVADAPQGDSAASSGA